jgi:hypothetical protein
VRAHRVPAAIDTRSAIAERSDTDSDAQRDVERLDDVDRFGVARGVVNCDALLTTWIAAVVLTVMSH